MTPGDVVADRFVLLGLAGSGAMGEVFRATDRTTGRTVALKWTEHAGGAQARPRLSREARLLADLSHPAIVGYVGHGTTGRGTYIAMEWLEGETLAARLERGALSIPDALTLGARVAEALCEAHGHGIIHRDIKPANLFLVGGRVADVKVLDFGIAHQYAAQRLTLRKVIGTPAYMAPEHARGDSDLDARADLFSLGCVLFECLTGRRAFEGDQALSVVLRVVLEEPPAVRLLRPDVSAQLSDVVGRLLVKDREGRPRKAREVAQMLAAASTDASPPPLLPPIRPSITTMEQTLLSVVVAASRDSGESGPALDADRLAQLTLRHGGRPVWVHPGAMALVWRGSGDQSATDLTAYAARCAMTAQREMGAQVSFSLATGRGVWSGGSPIGEALDRAVSSLRDDSEGKVRIDEVTERLLPGQFEVVGAPGCRQLESERVTADAVRTLLGRKTPCVGRRKELALLEAAYDECFEEPAAQVVWLEGEAGVGKSRLRHELVQRLRSRDPAPLVWTGRADPMRTTAPFGLLGHTLRGVIGLSEGDTKTFMRQRLSEWVRPLARPGEAERLTAFLGEMVGLSAEGHAPELRAAYQDPTLMGDQLERAFVDVVRAVTAEAPLVLVLEDVQWGDVPSLRVIGAALRRLKEKPWMVLILTRPDPPQRLQVQLPTQNMQFLELHRLRPPRVCRTCKKRAGRRHSRGGARGTGAPSGRPRLLP